MITMLRPLASRQNIASEEMWRAVAIFLIGGIWRQIMINRTTFLLLPALVPPCATVHGQETADYQIHIKVTWSTYSTSVTD